MDNLVNRAREFATTAHNAVNQKRNYTGEPYIKHPEAVVALVSSVPHTPEMLAAAWLHDVVEDTGIPIEEIEEEFGPQVAELVGWLTDVSKRTDGNRAVRKAIDRQHTASAPPQAKTIKLADLIDNTKTVTKYDPDFAKVYMVEKRLLLEVLKEGDLYLWEIAHGIVDVYFKQTGASDEAYNAAE